MWGLGLSRIVKVNVHLKYCCRVLVVSFGEGFTQLAPVRNVRCSLVVIFGTTFKCMCMCECEYTCVCVCLRMYYSLYWDQVVPVDWSLRVYFIVNKLLLDFTLLAYITCKSGFSCGFLTLLAGQVTVQVNANQDGQPHCLGGEVVGLGNIHSDLGVTGFVGATN